MTFYLKYRPQTISELDQLGVRETLSKIAASPDMPHAFLFSGPKGTGKTSAARILAKVINCEKQGSEPCNKCDACISISKGYSLDVIELDAASHRGIEDIRSIRDAIKLAPAKAKKKVYIIDEAHMLTTEASNALLKILEEPPSHVVFILATTNPEKLIPTIRSRTLQLNFKKAGLDEIAESLRKVAKGEKLEVQKEALTEIAKFADGSFRDAHKIFEQLIAEVEELTLPSIRSKLNFENKFDLDLFLQSLAKRDTKKSIFAVEEAIEKGVSAKEIANKIIASLREELLLRVLQNKKNVEPFANSELIALIKLLSDAGSQLATSYIEQIPLEIAIVEWCEEDSITKSSTSTAGAAGSGSSRSEKKESDEKNVKVDKKLSVVEEKSYKNVNNLHEKTKAETTNGATKTEKLTTEETKNGHNGNGHISPNNGHVVEINETIWSAILSKVKPGHTSTEALLRAAKPLNFDGSILKLGVYYKFHKEHLEGTPHRDILEDALEEYLGNRVRVVCTLTDPPIKNDTGGREEVATIANGSVVLTEPEAPAITTNTPLTGNNQEDIISLAEKIFSS